MTVTIDVIRNAENTNTLLHRPIVKLNDDMPQSGGCMTYELLNFLAAHVSKETGRRLWGEIVEKGCTVLETNTIIDAA